MIILRGIRWFLGVPIGYAAYLGLIKLNAVVMVFLFRWIPSETLWSIESVFASSIVSVYIGVVIAYFCLPRDDFPLINNKKVKALKYVINLWVCLQLIIVGVSISEIVKYGFGDGAIYFVLYPLVAIFTMKASLNAIIMIDYKHNQVYRDYYENQATDEGTKTMIDVSQ